MFGARFHNPLFWETPVSGSARCPWILSMCRPHPMTRGTELRYLCVVNQLVDKQKPFRRYVSKCPSHVRTSHPFWNPDTTAHVQILPQSRKKELIIIGRA